MIGAGATKRTENNIEIGELKETEEMKEEGKLNVSSGHSGWHQSLVLSLVRRSKGLSVTRKTDCPDSFKAVQPTRCSRS